MKKRNLEKGEVGFIAALGIVSLVCLIGSLKIYLNAPTLNGEGTMPLLVSVILLVMTVIIFLEMRGCPKGFEKGMPAVQKCKELFQFIFPGQVGVVIAYCIVYAVLLSFVGFIISTFAFLVGSMLTLNQEKKLQSVIISAVTLACIMVLFQFIFKVQMP